MSFFRRSPRAWIAFGMFVFFLLSLTAWYFTADRLPREIRIATGAKGGLYYKTGELLAAILREQTSRDVRVIETRGSVENRALLLNGEAELILFQDGSAPLEGLAPLTALYDDCIAILVRRGRGIQHMRDLAGRRVAIGPDGSGMRESALLLLKHYRIAPAELKETGRYFGELLEDSSLDAAIVTTGMLNEDLAQVLGSGQFELLGELDTEALRVHYPFLRPVVVPRGVFSEGPPVPQQDVRTVAASALLTVRHDAPARLVDAAMRAVYESDLGVKLPTLIAMSEARENTPFLQHPAARAYFDPYEGVGILANFLESISAVKELLFALGAGIYLLWDRYQRQQEAIKQAEVTQQKERLDGFLMETIEIERAQYDTTDANLLQKMLKDVSEIKFRALRELTAEQLRGDGLFRIFLDQCNGLAREIDARLLRVTRGEKPDAANAPNAQAAPVVPGGKARA
jgi:TRAP transporter TAXI family solute receptor